MPWSETLSSVNHQLAKIPQQNVAKALTAVLLLYLAYLLSQFTWLLMGQTGVVDVNQSRSTIVSHNNEQSVDINSLIKLHLFGQYQQTTSQPSISAEVQNAPETHLNLTLTGVVASDSKGLGAAIIENNGQQDTYGINDTIIGTRATLAKVMSDRVIINVSGKLETLMLDGFKYQKLSVVSEPVKTQNAKGTTTEPRKQLFDQRGNKALVHTVAKLRSDLAKHPAKLTDYLRIMPFLHEGKIKGYRLLPGNDPHFFQQSGLKTGDIALQINGLDLTDAKQAMQALQALREQQNITLTVQREGQLTDILFSIAN